MLFLNKETIDVHHVVAQGCVVIILKVKSSQDRRKGM